MPTPTNPSPKFHALHYNFTAKRIREAGEDYLANPAWIDIVTAGIVLSDLATRFAYSFEKDNPLFDRERFIKACKPNPPLTSPVGGLE